MGKNLEVIAVNDVSGVCALSATGAKISKGVDFDQWKEIGKSMAKASRSLQWWIGDWLNYGVREYGDKRALAIEHAEMFGLDSETVRAAMWVAGKVVLRSTSLPWRHHREVASLSPKEQKQWLKKAEENKWSVSDLRLALRQDGKEVMQVETGGLGFNPLRMALDFNRWAKQQDVSAMQPEAREALKRELKPVVDLWGKL